MTTPNEELIAELQQLANEIEISYRIESIEEAVKALQSQAERIAELERESETHSKAYGLAIVERDNLRHELKTAQEGWRCECSTDDACRFARERDALRAELAEIAAAEPVAWLYTTHAGGVQAFTNEPPPRLKELCKPLFNRAISPVKREPMSDGALIDAVANSIAEATRPMPAQDVTELVEALEEYGRAGVGNSTDWRVQLSALRLATAALSKYKGAK